jgi:hypothetical protein
MLPDGVQLIFQLRFLGSSRDEGLDFIQLTGIARLESTRVVKDKTVGRGIHDFVFNVVFSTLNDFPSLRNVENVKRNRYMGTNLFGRFQIFLNLHNTMSSFQ